METIDLENGDLPLNEKQERNCMTDTVKRRLKTVLIAVSSIIVFTSIVTVCGICVQGHC